MKTKTIVTGKNRKQLRALALNLDVELETTKLEKIAGAKKVAELRAKHNLLKQLSQNAEEELKSVRANLTEAVDTNINISKEHYQLEKDKLALEEKIEKLEQKDKLSMLTIEARDKTIMNLRSTVDDLREEVEQLKKEANKSLWKKVFKC